jgi:alkylhydroperoxidase family enzyme
VLEDWRTAPIDDRLKGTLGFLEKLTLEPLAVAPADIDALRALGLSDQAIEDAVHVCALFNIIDRVADSLGFDVPDAAAFASTARLVLKRGYL